MNYQEHIIRLQTEVNRTFGRTVTSMFDFELLAEKIHLSTQTLRRFYGKIDKDKTAERCKPQPNLPVHRFCRLGEFLCPTCYP